MAKNLAIKVARAEKDLTQKALGKKSDDLFWEEDEDEENY